MTMVLSFLTSVWVPVKNSINPKKGIIPLEENRVCMGSPSSAQRSATPKDWDTVVMMAPRKRGIIIKPPGNELKILWRGNSCLALLSFRSIALPSLRVRLA